MFRTLKYVFRLCREHTPYLGTFGFIISAVVTDLDAFKSVRLKVLSCPPKPPTTNILSLITTHLLDLAELH